MGPRSLFCLALLLSAVPGQDSRPAAAARFRQSFVDAEPTEVLRRIAMTGNLSLAVCGRIEMRVTCDFDTANAREALDVLGDRLGFDVMPDRFGVHRLVAWPERANLLSARPQVVAGGELESAVRTVAKAIGTPIFVGPGVRGPLAERIDLSRGVVGLRDALPKEAALVERDGVFRILLREPATPRAPSFSFESTPLTTALQQIGDAGRVSVMADPGIRGTVTMYLQEVPWRHALRLAALAVHAVEVRQQDGSYVLRPSEILRSVTVDGTELEVTRAITMVSTEDLSLSCPALAQRWRGLLGPLAIPADEPLPEGTVLATPFRMSSPMVLARLLSDLLDLEFVEQEGRLSLRALQR